MNSWWQRRTLKLRLTLWYAVATAIVFTLFAWAVYEVVEHRLAAELDRQLRIDFDLIEAQLDADDAGQIRWPVKGAHGDEGFARLSAWFEVWSEGKQLLFRHWPVREANITRTLHAPLESTLHFQTTELEPGLRVRLMERPARIHDRGVIVRVFRDETEMRHTLAEIVEVFLLATPLAVLLASLGGYLVAKRSLIPVVAMAEQARKITSESLGQRLPNSNPHDELGQLATVFNQTLERLEGSFAELKRFTGDASHELRTPLTALRAVGEVSLRDGNDVAAMREGIASMLEEAQRLNDLIESLLTLARMESGKVLVKAARIELAKVVDDVRESLEVLATAKQQTFDVQNGGTVSATVDPVLLRQALMNVLHNAVRYAPPQTRITIRIVQRDGHGIIEVIDEGPGIAAEHLPKLFDRFYRVDKSRSREGGGNGLGLAIAKWSIERQGGRLEVESAVGKGSTFRVWLPA